MKSLICGGLLLLLAITVAHAGSQTSFTHALRAGYTAGNDAVSYEDYFGDKKKKKKKKRSGHAVFQQGGGISLLVAPANANTDGIDNHALGFAVSYFPSLKIVGVGDHALRLAFSPSVYSDFKFNSREGYSPGETGGGLANIVLDLPATLELHLGDPERGAGFGGHIGAGFGYNYMSSDGVAVNSAVGPCITGGIRWNTFGRTWGLRGGYLLNVKSKKDDYGFKPKNVVSVAFCTYF